MVHIWTIMLVDSLKAPQHVGHVAPQSVPEQNAIHDPPGPWDGGTVGAVLGWVLTMRTTWKTCP